ncbi:MAG: nicotinate phosphoribosyltransferase [Deltaproteobacteria bacterium]|nr:nicotinate phosphoribosyltransferase [Deltaproteobacteria bacterium]
MLHTATSQQIRDGLVTDVYFERTEKILRAKGIDREVRAEFMAKGLPGEWPWAVFAGVEECLALLQDLPVDVRIMKEGTLIRPFQPVLEIHGKYLDFGKYETALLGLICQASGVATMAARCRKAAGERRVISFGARRMHPAIAPLVERNAYIGGCDGVAVGLGADLVGTEPVGTMPHALILIMGDTVTATQAFHEVIEPHVRRVSLIDTFNDEKIEALNVAKALGDNLNAIRLDTPGSRRGDFNKIMEEVRWELDIRGYGHVKILLSGGLDEYQIMKYNDFADGYGVGTAISNAPVVDFSMDIIEIEGEPIAKRGKRSGSKSVYRCPDCLDTSVLPVGTSPGQCRCGGNKEELLEAFLSEGRKRPPFPGPEEIRSFVIRQLEKVEL